MAVSIVRQVWKGWFGGAYLQPLDTQIVTGSFLLLHWVTGSMWPPDHAPS